MTATVTEIAGKIGVVLPPETAESLRLKAGEELQIVSTPNGIELSRQCDEATLQKRIFERVIAEDEQALQKLAE